MELLLNLVWLTLVLPAFWVWRRQAAHTKYARGYSRLRSSLLLICGLTLLFPVVSATDDLHPMRTEMDESSPLKRVVKQSSSYAWASWLSIPSIFLTRSITDSRICLSSEVCALVSPSSFIFPELLPYGQRDSRPPPALLLG